MADATIRGTYRRNPPPRASAGKKPSFRTAEECVYRMPTVEEVVAAGYPASYWDMVKARRDEFIRRFESDPAFAADARKRAEEDWEAARRQERDRR